MSEEGSISSGELGVSSEVGPDSPAEDLPITTTVVEPRGESEDASGDETIQELAKMVQQGMPSTFYIVPETGPKDMLLVEFSIFRDAPYEEDNVLVRLFADAKYARPRILGTHTDGRIMFYLPVPGDILPVLISLCRFVNLRFDMERILGQGWGEKRDIVLLRHYMHYYGPGLPLRLKRIRDEEQAARDDAAKKQRLAEIEVDPRMQTIKQMAQAVAKDIREEHPGWSAFVVAGSQIPTLCCQYVHRYHNGAPANVVTYTVDAPDCAAKPVIMVAYEMGYRVTKEEEVSYFNEILAGNLVLANALVPTIAHTMRINRKSKAKRGFTTSHWPSPWTHLIGNHGDVWQLEIRRQAAEPKKRTRFLD